MTEIGRARFVIFVSRTDGRTDECSSAGGVEFKSTVGYRRYVFVTIMGLEMYPRGSERNVMQQQRLDWGTLQETSTPIP